MTANLFGRHAGGDQRHIDGLNKLLNRLSSANSLTDVIAVQCAALTAGLPSHLDPHNRINIAMCGVNQQRWRPGRNALRGVLEAFASKLAPSPGGVENTAPAGTPPPPQRPGTRRLSASSSAQNARNAPVAHAPPPLPPRPVPPPPAPVPRQDPLREAVETARRVEPKPAPAAPPAPAPAPAPPAPLPPATGEEPGRRRGRPPDDQAADATPAEPSSEPPKKRRGRPPKKEVPATVPAKRGRPAKAQTVPDLEVWLITAMTEFLLGVDPKLWPEKMRGLAAAAFRGTPWRPSEAALKQWPYPEARRGRLAAEGARVREELTALATSLPGIVVPLQPDQALLDYFRQNLAHFRDMDKDRRKAKRARLADAGGDAAEARILAGRPAKPLEVALEVRKKVHRDKQSMRKVAKWMTGDGSKGTISSSYVSEILRVLDQASRMYFRRHFLLPYYLFDAYEGLGLSFDSGSVSEAVAGTRLKLYSSGVEAPSTLRRVDAPRGRRDVAASPRLTLDAQAHRDRSCDHPRRAGSED